uniref:Uncharacterized protein n=1 Tax=Anguilla anguilla TaxID=7936 RepID=A0A0E9R4H6_ANGAN
MVYLVPIIGLTLCSY